MKYLKLLLIFIPVSIVCRLLQLDGSIIFVMTCLSIVPLAIIIGNATEQISFYTGPKIGGLLNATMSNIPELLIGLFAVMAGRYSLVMASMAGSIMGNVLLVLGFSVFFGGLKYKFQSFNKAIARANFTMLTFAAISFIIPLAFKHATEGTESFNKGIPVLSLGISLILIITYLLGLVFSLVTHISIFTQRDEESHKDEEGSPKWKLSSSILILSAAAVLVAVQSEALVSTVEQVVRTFGIPEAFIGIVLIPILGNVAENASAIIMAVKNKVDISVEIAVGSSMQIAMFVAPLLVIISFIQGHPMAYVYNFFEVVSMLIGICMAVYVFQDGKTNWLEGIQLIGCYIILALAFFYLY